jgi:SAM-dependent methyltransferase
MIGAAARLDPKGNDMSTPGGWDESYTRDTPPPWDIGRPQPTFVRLANEGLLRGRLLDSGCGTGENALMAAAKGAEAVGVDLAASAIERARAKAAERGIAARFEVASVLELGRLGLTFDTIMDSGAFHVFDNDDRVRYVASLGSVLEPGGSLYLMCFSDREPGDWGPRRVRRDELVDAFSDGWTIDSITPDMFDINPVMGNDVVQAWLAVLRRA